MARGLPWVPRRGHSPAAARWHKGWAPRASAAATGPFRPGGRARVAVEGQPWWGSTSQGIGEAVAVKSSPNPAPQAA